MQAIKRWLLFFSFLSLQSTGQAAAAMPDPTLWPPLYRKGWLRLAYEPTLASLGQKPSLPTTYASSRPCPPDAEELCRRTPLPSPRSSKEAFQQALALYKQGDFFTAASLLDSLQKREDAPPKTKFYLAQSYLRLGDAFGKKGHAKEQRFYYQQALREDPLLVENPRFIASYRSLQRNDSLDAPLPATSTPRKKRFFNLGLGLTAGIEGLGGIHASLLLWGMLNPSVTFAPASPTLDFSFRLIPLRGYAWSPYIGGGIVLPLRGWEGTLTQIFPEPVLHFSLGVHYLSELGFSFTLGVNLVYNLDPKAVYPLLPLPSLHLLWYF